MKSAIPTHSKPTASLLVIALLLATLPATSKAESSMEGRFHTTAIAIQSHSLRLEGRPSAKVARGYSIQFESNSSDIQLEFRPRLDELGRLMQIDEARQTGLTIEGHADATGPASENVELSERRALAIANYLVRNWGIDPDRLTLKGYGESDPLVPEESASPLNRRVQFKITD